MKGHWVKTLPVADLKAHLSEALREVEAGGRIIVERRGKPIAVLIPHEGSEVDRRDWWRELEGIAAEIDDFQEIMRDAVRSRRKEIPRPVDLGE